MRQTTARTSMLAGPAVTYREGTPELMDRMGHSTSRAALTYLHYTNDRQPILADAVADRVQSELRQAREDAQ